MCGIAAKIGGGPVPKEALDALGKRGPDDRGFLQFKNAALGHTRLSILDLAGGHQPMEDKLRGTAISFNGEIYNFKELRVELEKLGHKFMSNSDTEVILKAYDQWQELCPEHLDGMFAFAIWDEQKQQLFLARDRFGKKPLYYAFTDRNELCVASEIPALIAMGIKPLIDPLGIDLYLQLMYMPPWRTVYSNVHTLQPAHCALYKDHKINIRKYWELPQKPLSISYDEAKEETRRLITEAVRVRMIADVEVGSFLSGGVDSTLITWYAQKFLDRPIKTFSLGYGDLINELPFAKEAAEKIGTDHHTLQATSNLTDELEEVLAYFDEPHGDSADFPQHLVSKLASEKVKVALAGDGGDELFMGYGWYFAYFNRPRIIQLKNLMFSDAFSEHIKSITVFPENMRTSLFRSPVASERIDALVDGDRGNGMEKINHFDLMTYLPGQLLTKVDRMSMMHSLEVRCPLLDHHLAEFAVNLPTEFKATRDTGKLLLKDLLHELMPRKFVDRKKQGFGGPVRLWFQNDPKFFAYAQNKLTKDPRVGQFLNPDKVTQFVERVMRNSDSKPYYQLWVLLCLEIWLEKHGY